MKSRTKKFSALILILIIADLAINISKTNALSKDKVSLDNYTLIESIKKVTHKNIDKDIVRISRNNKQTESQFLSSLIDKILHIDSEIAEKIIEKHRDFLGQYVVLQKYSVNEKSLNSAKEMLENAAEETISSMCEDSDIREYEIFCISKKKSSYISDACSMRIHNVFISNDVYEKKVAKTNNRLQKGVVQENAIIHVKPPIYTIHDHIVKSRYLIERLGAASKQTARLYLREQNVVGIFSEFGYIQLTMGESTEALSSVKVQFSTQKMRQNRTYNYIFNNTINSHTFEIKNDEILSIGKIYSIGALIDYDVLSKIVSSTIDKEKLEEILDSIDTNLLNTRDEVIIFTRTGALLVRKKKCKDVKVMKQMLITEMALQRSGKQGVKQIIETPLDSPHIFMKDFKESFGIDFKDLTKTRIIDYYNCQMITLEKAFHDFPIIIPEQNKVAIKIATESISED